MAEPREDLVTRLKSEITRRPRSAPPRRERELTPELAERLIQATRDHLYLPQMAASCGVEPALLKLWIAKGRAENAPPLYEDFALRFLAADADVQRLVMQMFATVAKAGKRAEQLLKFMDRRWPQGNNPRSLEAETANAPVIDVRELLAEPPAALVAALQQAGTVRHLLSREALQTPEAQALIEELGYSKTEG
jgi:hypothetical protein